jgi:hypothetical protein
MKINKTYQVELSIEDCKRCLYNYQYDAITQLVEQMQKNELLTSVTDVSHFAIGLLKGQHNPEFVELLELYNVCWIDTPTFDSGWGKTVEQFPGTFELDPIIEQYVRDAHGVTKLQVTVNGQLIDTKEILANI